MIRFLSLFTVLHFGIVFGKIDLIKAQRCVFEKDTLTGIMVCTNADIYPRYSGGDSHLMEYIQKNLKIVDPTNIICTYVIEIIINEKGEIIDARSASKESEHNLNVIDFIEAVKRMPKWIPGECNHTNVTMRYKIPVRIHPQ